MGQKCIDIQETQMSMLSWQMHLITMHLSRFRPTELVKAKSIHADSET